MPSVSVSKQKAPGVNLEDMLKVALDADETSSRLAELTRATAAHSKAVAAHTTADRIDELLVETKNDRVAARATLSKARQKAEEIVAAAETKAQEIVSRGNAEASKEAARQRRLVRQAQEKVKTREDAVEKKEQEIDPIYADAASKMEEAETMMNQAARLKSSYEGRMQRLKAVLKEANL